ncbi:MAG: hypothetical protein IPN79_18545 [Saprospiraceae bacterium]|nr:hypothetical protein [Saprospiraceae bacterium]
MNSKYYAFHTKSYFGGPVDIDINKYQPIKQKFLDFWDKQRSWSDLTFKYESPGKNPFANILFSSKGQYEIANDYNGLGPNFIFVSDRMLEIFESVNVPKYELFPINYRQRGNIYKGYFLAFLEDYTNYVDFSNSKICYKPFGHEYYIPMKFQSGEDFSAFIRENASLLHEDGNTNLGDFRYPEIRFLDFVYEIDLLCIPFLITTFLMSDRLKSRLENEKIKNIQFFDVMGTHYKFNDYTLNLDEDKFC